MQSNFKTFKEDKAANLEIAHAPSKLSAVRMDAETLVKVAIENGVGDQNDCLSRYFLGKVSIDLVKHSDAIWYVIHYNEDLQVFAITVVVTNR